MQRVEASRSSTRWKNPSARTPRSRSGTVVLELLVTIPVLFVGTLAVFEFALLGLAMQLVATASIEGTRSASLVGATTDSVQDAVEQILGVQGITLADGAAVRIEGQKFVMTPQEFGEPGLLGPIPVSPVLMANEVRVTVAVATLIANNRPVPNWLSGMGFNLGNRAIQYSTLLTNE